MAGALKLEGVGPIIECIIIMYILFFSYCLAEYHIQLCIFNDKIIETLLDWYHPWCLVLAVPTFPTQFVPENT